MDFVNTRAIEVTRLALDGLVERQKSIASNTANFMTPNYQRKDVAFEDQLVKIIEKDNIRKDLRIINSYGTPEDRRLNPNNIAQTLTQPNKLPLEQLKFLSEKDYSAFKPEILRDMDVYDPITGNNVDIENEMMNMAKTGSKYSALATLEGRMFSGLADVIKG